MGKDINIDSAQWRDVVFEGKNKEYGAYRLRASSGKRHIVAFGVVIILVIAVMLLPFAVDFVESRIPKPDVGPMEDSFELTKVEVPPKEEKVPEENILKQVAEPPPPPELKTTVKFVAPVIVPDEEVADDETMRSQEELQDLKGSISIADVEGSDAPDAVDISELENQQVIVQVPPEEPKTYDIAEVMPSYPGGDPERIKFLNDNVNYPQMARENGISGVVTVGFVVSASGKLENIRILRGKDRLLDEEALRVVKKMPNWIPGKQGGKNVAVNFSIQVRFQLK